MLGISAIAGAAGDLLFNDGATIGKFFEPASDFFSGYTSANSAQRFAIENAVMQQKLNESNMKLQHMYERQNMALTDKYQRALISDTPSLQVDALRRAGLNPLLAIDKGITSAQSAVHASTPTSQTPSIATPQVQPKLGDVANTVSQAFGVGGQMAGIVLQGAQARAADAASAESAARTLKTMKEADALSPELEQRVKSQVGNAAELSAQSRAVDTVAHFGGAAASAYSAKKASDVARLALTKGVKAEAAKDLAAKTVSKSSANSAKTAVKFLKNFGMLGLPLAIGTGVGAAHLKEDKKLSSKEKAIRNKMRSASQGYGSPF